MIEGLPEWWDSSEVLFYHSSLVLYDLYVLMHNKSSLAENGEKSVLTLGSLCLTCYVPDKKSNKIKILINKLLHTFVLDMY